MSKKLQVAVLISGGGSNLQALIDACKSPEFPAEIKLVISNKQDAYGLIRAENDNIATKFINHKDFKDRESFDQEIDKALCEYNIEFICLAGFMRLLSAWFSQKWQDKMINIHPSLLPSFKGENAQKQAFEYGVKIAGCTVHYVTPQMDAGPIICQECVTIEEDDDLASVKAKILAKEHFIYPKSLQKIASKLIQNDK